MPDYKTMYLHLFNHVTDAVAAMETLNFGQAKDILMGAQREAEQLYINGGPESEVNDR